MKRTQKGFTLVEIMIVVVIIGLLAAMAIPAFQKVRQSSVEKTLLNDAKQVAGAANQYLMEYGVSEVSFDYTSATGVVAATSPLYVYVKKVSKNNVLPTQWNTTTTQYTVQNAALNPSTINIGPEGQKID
jgi:prepilin-type N-terminal cleavage/methylation domain-containing protein